jgi:hypothetical protein
MNDDWRPDLARITARVAQRMREEGHPYAEVAARLLAARARAGLSADELGVFACVADEGVLAAEDGRSLSLATQLLGVLERT